MLCITDNAERFDFGSGCVVWVAKSLKDGWFILLW